MDPGDRERVAGTAVCVIGPNAIGRPIDRLAEIDEKVRTSEGRRDEANGGEYHRLLDGISNTDWESWIGLFEQPVGCG